MGTKLERKDTSVLANYGHHITFEDCPPDCLLANAEEKIKSPIDYEAQYDETARDNSAAQMGFARNGECEVGFSAVCYIKASKKHPQF